MYIGDYLKNDRELVLLITLCTSEVSTLDYTVSHQGLYEHVCGVDPLWIPYLEDKGIEYNSIQAAWAVFSYYLEQENSEYLALLKYKGVSKNKKVKNIAKKIIKITNTLTE